METKVTKKLNGMPLMDLAMSMAMEADMTISEVYEDGSARADMIFTRYDLESGVPEAEAELEALGEAIVGLTAWQTMDD